MKIKLSVFASAFILSASLSYASSTQTKSTTQAQTLLSGKQFCTGFDSELEKHFENTLKDKSGKSYFTAEDENEDLEGIKSRLASLTVKKCVANKNQAKTSLCYAQSIAGMYNGKDKSTEAVILINDSADCIYDAYPAKM